MQGLCKQLSCIVVNPPRSPSLFSFLTQAIHLWLLGSADVQAEQQDVHVVLSVRMIATLMYILRSYAGEVLVCTFLLYLPFPFLPCCIYCRLTTVPNNFHPPLGCQCPLTVPNKSEIRAPRQAMQWSSTASDADGCKGTGRPAEATEVAVFRVTMLC